MNEDQKQTVEQTVQAVSKAWDKWPIITCCGLIACLALLLVGYNQYKLFQYLGCGG